MRLTEKPQVGSRMVSYRAGIYIYTVGNYSMLYNKRTSATQRRSPASRPGVSSPTHTLERHMQRARRTACLHKRQSAAAREAVVPHEFEWPCYESG